MITERDVLNLEFIYEMSYIATAEWIWNDSNFIHLFNSMKRKDTHHTRGYPYRGYPPAAGCNWLRVDFDEGGAVPGKKPSESDWDRLKLSPHVTRGQGWTWVTDVGGEPQNRDQLGRSVGAATWAAAKEAWKKYRPIRPCHTAAILSRETKKALFYHAKPRSGNHGREAWRGKTKLFWSPGTIWPPCDKGE